MATGAEVRVSEVIPIQVGDNMLIGGSKVKVTVLSVGIETTKKGSMGIAQFVVDCRDDWFEVLGENFEEKVRRGRPSFTKTEGSKGATRYLGSGRPFTVIIIAQTDFTKWTEWLLSARNAGEEKNVAEIVPDTDGPDTTDYPPFLTVTAPNGKSIFVCEIDWTSGVNIKVSLSDS